MLVLRRYSVVNKRKDCCQQISELIREQFPDECGIVYCITIADCEKIYTRLLLDGISAAVFHGKSKLNDSKQHEWHTDQIKVIVATKAFGMGINKPNVCCALVVVAGIHSCLYGCSVDTTGPFCHSLEHAIVQVCTFSREWPGVGMVSMQSAFCSAAPSTSTATRHCWSSNRLKQAYP